MMQDAFNGCTAAKSAATQNYVACQNKLINIEISSVNNANANGECRALLGDCEGRLQALLNPQPLR